MCERTDKLLGVEIDYLLKFDDQISCICKKASQQINVIKHIDFFLILSQRKSFFTLLSCKALISVCSSGISSCSKTNTDKLEKVRFRALKFLLQDFS